MGWFDDIMRNIFGGQESTSQQTQQSTSQSQQQQQASQQGTSNSQSTSTPSNLNPFSSSLGNQFSSLLSSYMSNGIQQAPGPYTAPIGAGETSALRDMAATTGPGTARADLLRRTMGGEFLPGQSGSNPFLEGMIKSAQRGNLQGLEEVLGRTLPGRFNLAGQTSAPEGSSAFDHEAALATGRVAQANADIATNMSGQAYESERGRQTQAIQLDQAEVDNTIKNLQAQALPRMIQDMGIERGLAEFKSRTQSMLQLLAVIGGVTTPVIGNTTQSTGTAQQTGTSTGSGSSSSSGSGQGTSSDRRSGNVFSSLFPRGTS